MKKIVLLALSLFVFIACDKDDSPEDILKAKLIGEWEEYGYYWINKGINKPNDTTYYNYIERVKYWVFRSNATYDGNGFKEEPYYIKNDSLHISGSMEHIDFKGDSLILTTNWFGTNNHTKYIYVMYPKGYKD